MCIVRELYVKVFLNLCRTWRKTSHERSSVRCRNEKFFNIWSWDIFLPFIYIGSYTYSAAKTFSLLTKEMVCRGSRKIRAWNWDRQHMFPGERGNLNGTLMRVFSSRYYVLEPNFNANSISFLFLRVF